MPQEQDSIQIQTVIAYPKKEDSLLVTTASERKSFVGRELHKPHYDLVLSGGTLLASLLLFICYLQIKKFPVKTKLLPYFFQSAEREEVLYSPIINIFQHCFALAVSISLCYFLVKDFFNLPKWQIFLYTTGCFLCYISTKSLLVFFTGYSIDKFSIAKNHHRIIRSVSKQMGLLLFPFLFLAFFFPSETYLIILVGCFLLYISKILIQLFFVSKLLNAHKFSSFHSFLYLCTLEILPFIYLVLGAAYLVSNN